MTGRWLRRIKDSSDSSLQLLPPQSYITCIDHAVRRPRGDTHSGFYLGNIFAGSKTSLKISISSRWVGATFAFVFPFELLPDAFELVFELASFFDDLSGLGFGLVPSRGSNAKTTLEKCPRNSASKYRRSRHIVATSRVGLRKIGPHPKAPSARSEYPHHTAMRRTVRILSRMSSFSCSKEYFSPVGSSFGRRTGGTEMTGSAGNN